MLSVQIIYINIYILNNISETRKAAGYKAYNIITTSTNIYFQTFCFNVDVVYKFCHCQCR